eukprot:1161788-Pelagomonas_calceolata.AAC.3
MLVEGHSTNGSGLRAGPRCVLRKMEKHAGANASASLRDRNADKILRMGRGELSVYDELFRCVSFVLQTYLHCFLHGQMQLTRVLPVCAVFHQALHEDDSKAGTLQEEDSKAGGCARVLETKNALIVFLESPGKA